ncbi:MAG: response regulator [Chloroflexota bacterium]
MEPEQWSGGARIARAAQGSGGPIDTPSTEPVRVLVVDDDEDIREVVTMALEDEGHEVQAAPHGAAALERLRHWQPDVILLDMRMPVMDGWEFAHQYHQMPEPHAPIVVVTAARDALERATQIAAAGALAKPFEVDDLLAVVSRYSHHG